MNPVSKAELARLACVSRAAVTNKCKRGALPEMPDGTIDADDPAVKDYISKATYPRGGLKPGRSARRRPEKKETKKTKLYPDDDTDFSGVSADDELPEIPGYTGTENLNMFSGNEL